MRRKQISLHLGYPQYLLPIVFGIFIGSYYSEIYQANLQTILVTLVFIATAGLSYQLTEKLKAAFPNISFDSSYLYIGAMRTVPLNKIQSLKLTSKSIGWRYQIEIEYLGLQEELKVIRFFPRIAHKHLQEFCFAISEKNPDAQLENTFLGST